MMDTLREKMFIFILEKIYKLGWLTWRLRKKIGYSKNHRKFTKKCSVHMPNSALEKGFVLVRRQKFAVLINLIAYKKGIYHGMLNVFAMESPKKQLWSKNQKAKY